jgi:hypothetical protein
LLAAVALAVLAIHVAVIAFNVFGLMAIPPGSMLDWRFVRVFWWRALHLALLALLVPRRRSAPLLSDAVAGHARAGRRRAPVAVALIARLVERVVFWPLPIWFFAALYVAVWIYALALWPLVPPTRR